MESESSDLEASVEDSGLIGEVETIDDKVVSASAAVEADKDERTTPDLDKPAYSPPPISKGFGLRKWRRRRRRTRRDLVKYDTSVNVENSKVLKRVFSGGADPNAKQMHFPGPDVKQDSLGSVSSVNNVAGFGTGGSSHGAGLASDNSEDQSSMSSTAASGPKVRCERKTVISLSEQRKSRVENSKGGGGRGERIRIDKENSHSSMESADSRSSNFLFMQGASSSLSTRETGGRRMVDYNEEDSDLDAHTSNRKDHVGEEETGDHSQGDFVEESEIKNNVDPLTEAFNSYQNLQEALDKELQKFQELGKESVSSLHDGAETSTCIHAGHERGSEASSSLRVGSELGLTSLDSEILNLVNNVEHLEIKLEETKCILEVKESQIRELESTISVSEPRNLGTEIGIDDNFQQKMEAEIEYLVFSSSVDDLKRRIKVVEEEKILAENEAHKMLSKLGEAETKAENLKSQAQDLQNHCVEITEIQEVKSFKKRIFRTTSCLLLQLGLLFMLFNIRFLQESEIVVPT